MIKVLVIDDSPEILDLLELFLSNEDNINCITQNSGNNAVAFLKAKKEDISVILSDFRMPDGDGGVVYNYNDESLKAPFIFHTSTSEEDLTNIKDSHEYKFKILDKPCPPDKLIETVYEFCNSNITTPKYFELSPFYCLKYFPLINSINISLSKDHFVEISNSDSPNKEYLEKLISDKGVQTFYVDAKSYKSLFTAITKAHDKTQISPKELILSVTGLAKGLMDDPKEAAFAADQITNVTATLFENKNTAKIINSLFNDSEFMITHSLLTSFLCYRFLKASGRFTERDMKCFTEASFFHDIELTHKEEESEKNVLTNKFYEHESCAIAKLSNVKEISQKTLDLVEKHHFLEKGKFNRLSQDEKLFNSAHYIASIACQQRQFNFKEIVNFLEMTDIGNEVLEYLFPKKDQRAG